MELVDRSCNAIVTHVTIPTFEKHYYVVEVLLIILIIISFDFFYKLKHQRDSSTSVYIYGVLLDIPHILKCKLLTRLYLLLNHFRYSFSSWSWPQTCSIIILSICRSLLVVCCYNVSFARIQRSC